MSKQLLYKLDQLKAGKSPTRTRAQTPDVESERTAGGLRAATFESLARVCSVGGGEGPPGNGTEGRGAGAGVGVQPSARIRSGGLSGPSRARKSGKDGDGAGDGVGGSVKRCGGGGLGGGELHGNNAISPAAATTSGFKIPTVTRSYVGGDTGASEGGNRNPKP